MLASRAERGRDEVDLAPVDRPRRRCSRCRRACEEVHVSEPVGLYMVDIVTATREAQSIQVGASPRGSLALLKLSRCRAALDGRDYVTPDDVKSVAVPALAHRLTLRPELWVQRVSAEDVVRERLETVPTPAAEDLVAGTVTRYATPKLAAYASVSAVGLLTALVLARPELVALTAPFLLALGAGLALATPPRLTRRRRRSSTERALEGDEVRARIVLEPATPVDRLELSRGCRTASSSRTGRNPVALRLAPANGASSN